MLSPPHHALAPLPWGRRSAQEDDAAVPPQPAEGGRDRRAAHPDLHVPAPPEIPWDPRPLLRRGVVQCILGQGSLVGPPQGEPEDVEGGPQAAGALLPGGGE